VDGQTHARLVSLPEEREGRGRKGRNLEVMKQQKKVRGIGREIGMSHSMQKPSRRGKRTLRGKGSF